MKRIIFTIVFICATALKAYPHPHVFIDYSTTFVFNNDRFEGIQVVWIFDELFSSSMIHDYDKNHNRAIDNDEVRKIEDEAFSNLEDYNYFCTLIIGRDPFKVKQVRYFTASLLNGSRLVYSFFVPVQRSIRGEKKISFSIYDRTYFCSISINKDGGLAVKGIDPGSCRIEVKKNSNKSCYNGSVVPEEILLKKW